MDADLACYFATIGSVVIIIILLFDFLMDLRLICTHAIIYLLHSTLHPPSSITLALVKLQPHYCIISSAQDNISLPNTLAA